MRTVIRLAITAVILTAALAPLTAQSPNVFGAGVGTRPAAAMGRLSIDEVVIVTAWTEDADRYTVDGRLHDARRLLREVIAIERRGGAYTAPALRRLANVEFALNRPLVAASVLEEVAFAANAAGDPQTEIEALVDAMVLYAQEGHRSRAARLRPRAEQLLQSPVIPSELRERLARHLNTH